MKYRLLAVVVFFFTPIFGQKVCFTDIMSEEEIIPINKIDHFVKYNFSNLWLKTDNDLVYGIIGNEHQRILVKILKATKNPTNPREYFIKGKSSVKENVCDFEGTVTLQVINESKRTHFGIDNEFKYKGIKTQGLLIAKYEFLENKTQKHSGIFYGTVKTKWYLDKNNKIVYDNLNIHSDGYFNNAFVGIWKMYDSNVEKKCNWADYRVPNSDCDFDIGAGEFSVSEKYWKSGWLDIALKNKVQNQAIREGKQTQVKTRWWQ
jgi:hypothetical protein